MSLKQEKREKICWTNIRKIQICEQCVPESRANEHILADDINCDSTCEEWIEQKSVCEECTLLGHAYYQPSLRSCQNCVQKNQRCTRRVVLVLCADCEAGNKKAFEMMIVAISEDTMDPDLSLSTILPDAVHVGKSRKAAFANWMLVIGFERSCLGLLRMLNTVDVFYRSPSTHGTDHQLQRQTKLFWD